MSRLCEKAEIGKILLKDSIPFDERLQRVIEVLSSCLSVKKCSLMIVNPDDLTLEVKASTVADIIGEKRSISDVSIATRALLDGAPLYVDNQRRSFFSIENASNYSSAVSVSIPIKYLDKKLGVLNITDAEDEDVFATDRLEEITEATEILSPYLYAAYAHEVLGKKVKSLEEVQRRLLELDELKTNLTSFIVHDLKGPISTVIANLDLLNYEPLTPEQFEYLNLAIEDVYKMQRMVLNILDISKIEEEKIKIYREESDIYGLAQQEISSLKGLLSQKNLSISLKGEQRLCHVDENLMRRTVANLLMNAIEHSPEDGTIEVEISYNAAGRELVVSVSDEGAGVPNDMKEKIFDKFFQAGEGRRQRKTTTGLGLTFCKLVVDAHGGKIWVEDSDKGNARFLFTVPEIVHGGIL
jgi:two-component system sensor histidine kinase KdpD